MRCLTCGAAPIYLWLTTDCETCISSPEWTLCLALDPQVVRLLASGCGVSPEPEFDFGGWTAFGVALCCSRALGKGKLDQERDEVISVMDGGGGKGGNCGGSGETGGALDEGWVSNG